MKNDYKILEELKLVIIYCESKEKKNTVEVYIDYDVFLEIKKYEVKWKVWGEKSGRAYIAATYKKDGVFVNLYLKKVIANLLFGEEHHIRQIDEELFDLRAANLFCFEKAHFNNKENRIAFNKRKSAHISLKTILKDNYNEDLDNKISVCLDDKESNYFYLTEKGEVVFKFPRKYASVIFDFVDKNQNLMI